MNLRLLLIILSICIFSLSIAGTSATIAQNPDLNGLLLINVTELGASNNPDHLFLANVSDGKFAELLVENRGIFAPWFGWSPDGSKFAYLAPARRGSNYELWLGDASVTNPRPRPPLFDLGLNVTAADWNPNINVIAATTTNTTSPDAAGLYLVNANFENIVFLRPENLPPNPFLDWAHGGVWLAYGTLSGGVSMINVESEAVVPLLPQMITAPAFLPFNYTGWTDNDRYYVFADDRYQQLFAITTDGFGIATNFPEDFPSDPFSIRTVPDTSRLLTLDHNTIVMFDLTNQRIQTFPLDTPNEITSEYAVLDENTLLLNSFILIGEDRFAECLLVDLRDQSIRFIRDSFAAANWTHTRCVSLRGGEYIAIMATDELQPYDRLPDDWLYDLYIVPSSLTSSTFLTDTYAGFEKSELGFSLSRQQIVFQEGDALVVYNLQGQKKTLVTLRDLNITSEFVDFDYAWQP